MEQLGLSPKQKERARQTFMKSAQYAGFTRGGGCGGDEPPGIDPIIAGSLKRLPKSGEVWPETNTFSPVPTPLARFATGQTLPYADRNAYEHSRELAAPWRPSSI